MKQLKISSSTAAATHTIMHTHTYASTHAHAREHTHSLDFRKKKTPVDPLTINGAVIDTVDCFTFLGTTLSNTLGWDANVDVTVKKAQQRPFFLRQLKKFGLRRETLIRFYNSVEENVLTFSLCVCVCVVRQDDFAMKKKKNRLERVVRTSGRIIGCELPSLASIYKQAVCGQSEENPRGCIPLCLYSILPASSLWQTIPKFSRVGLGASRTVISTVWSAPCPLKTICDDVHPAAVHVCCRCFFFK